MTPAPIITARGVTRRFGAKTALDAVSLTVPRGSVFGLVGENGAGKTTLIKHVLGLLKAMTGTVRVFGNFHLPQSEFARRTFYATINSTIPMGNPYLRIFVDNSNFSNNVILYKINSISDFIK